VTLEELKAHGTPEDAWTVIHGHVFNITPYLRYHPGGQAELLRVAGKDGSELFSNYLGFCSGLTFAR
jgi:cytochrome b involved in lipid metabolism